jgi:hypothetical protein
VFPNSVLRIWRRRSTIDRAGEPARAISEAKLALSSEGNDINNERATHMLLARCYSLLGNAEEAAKEQRWIEAHPNPETPRKPNEESL